MGVPTSSPVDPLALSPAGRLLVLVVAVLGWLFAGVHMSITQLTATPAGQDFLAAVRGQPDYDVLLARWHSWFQCAFLFGAAAGGLVFGWLGDRIGRAKGMAASILTYSAFAGAAHFSQSPLQLWTLWFLACLGVGGMWPNGVVLLAEAWSNLSRPMVAGVIGTAANIGIYLFAKLAGLVAIAPNNWRWVMLVGAAPLGVGLFAWWAVPESPRWLASRQQPDAPQALRLPRGEVFRPPFLQITLLGILLATTPLLGGWGTANWMIPWADRAAMPPDPYLKATVLSTRSLTGIAGSLLGGWIASVVGRRRTYFLTSLASFLIAEYVFCFLVPTDPRFLFCVGALGFVSGIYFGWLPLCLPELFPTRIRSTGAGVSFNFGRILTAFTLFATGIMMHLFAGDYARIGRVSSLMFVLGIVAICLAPDTSQKQLEN